MYRSTKPVRELGAVDAHADRGVVSRPRQVSNELTVAARRVTAPVVSGGADGHRQIGECHSYRSWLAASRIGQVISRSRGAPIQFEKTTSDLHRYWCAILGLKMISRLLAIGHSTAQRREICLSAATLMSEERGRVRKYVRYC